MVPDPFSRPAPFFQASAFAVAIRRSGDDLVDGMHFLDSHQLLVQPAVEVGQAVGIEPQLVQYRCMQMFDVKRILDPPLPTSELTR